ncbi:MAG: twin transmembrane helix small protein [Xanthomonadaceae bacterium]|nr:twin transmembrane helix small protein [Xanthomonadaceae bacterium]
MIKALILATLVGIIISLGQALYCMTSGPSDDKKMVHALTVRVGLSVGLFVLLLVGWRFGVLAPHTL